ncbi:hypothetical protein TNCV_3544021 [Trichonephila clavipes]|nr:hypothetical protein TNCV_3544021 [Trichonephila clavipes]
MKFEAAQQATRKDRHPIRAVSESDTSNSEGGVGKLINGHLVGRRLPDFLESPTFKCVISTKSTGENGIFIMGHVNELPCNMIIDTGANVSHHSERSGSKN